VARTSIASTKTDLYNSLSSPALSGVTGVYAYEPGPGQMLRGTTITIQTSGVDPDTWLFTIRIYVDTRVDAQKAQDSLDTVILLVDDRLFSLGWAGPSNWTVDWAEDLESMVATSVLQVGREDAYD